MQRVFFFFNLSHCTAGRKSLPRLSVHSCPESVGTNDFRLFLISDSNLFCGTYTLLFISLGFQRYKWYLHLSGFMLRHAPSIAILKQIFVVCCVRCRMFLFYMSVFLSPSVLFSVKVWVSRKLP